MIVLTWAASCLLLGAIWSLWERRDATMLHERLALIAVMSPVALFYHFFAMIYLQVLSAILAIAVGIVTGLEWRWFMYLWAPLVICLTAGLGISAQRVFRNVVRDRGRTLITLKEAATLAGTTEYEVRKRCAVVNRDFDAMAYSDAMYSDKELVDRADAEIERRNRLETQAVDRRRRGMIHSTRECVEVMKDSGSCRR